VTILPFCPSVLWAQLISQASSWRYNGIVIGIWNFIGLLLVVFCYHDPSRLTAEYTATHVLSRIDYLGGFLSIGGITTFMMGLQWGARQVCVCSYLPSSCMAMADTRCSTRGEVLTTWHR
jgi:hypothetical protein